MTRYLTSIIVCSSLLFSIKLVAQSASTSRYSPVAKAEAAYQLLQYADAADYYVQALAKGFGPKPDLMKKIADCYWLLKNHKQAMQWYEQVEKSGQDTSELVNFRLGELKAIHGQYDEAVRLLSKVKGMDSRVNGFKNPNQFLNASADWNLSFMDINTGMFKEFSPLLMGNKLVWTTNEPRTISSKGVMGWDGFGYTRQLYFNSTASVKPVDPTVYYAYPTKVDSSSFKNLANHYAKSDNPLLQNVPLPASLVQRNQLRLNTPAELEGLRIVDYNVGHATASLATGRIYFSANDQDKVSKEAVRNLKIAEGRLTDQGIEDIRFLDIDTKGETVMHPAIHPNGQLLVYSSNRAGGKGGFDLYYVDRVNDSTWSAPTSLDNLNSRGNELFASFTPKGALYFSSDGLPGLGGLDLFRAEWKPGNSTAKPLHLDFPINSSYDDFGWAQNEDGSAGYFTTDRLGSDDIMGFTYKARFIKISGAVVDRQTRLRVADVKVALLEKDAEGNLAEHETTKTDKNGNYAFTGRPNKNYQVKVYEPEAPAEFYAVDASTFTAADRKELETVAVGKLKPAVAAPIAQPTKKLVLDSVYFIIYFDFDKANLTPASISELNRVAEFLAENKGYGFRLLGHTDLKGNQQYNLDLSKRRVKAAMNYLVRKGYPERQFAIDYYGKGQPVANGLDNLSGMKNRRVEFVLVKK